MNSCKYELRADEGDFKPEGQTMNMSGLLHIKRQRYDDVLEIWLRRSREVDGVFVGLRHAYPHVKCVLHIATLI